MAQQVRASWVGQRVGAERLQALEEALQASIARRDATQLEKLDKQHRITVVNAVDQFPFMPSNPWLAVGWSERDKITFSIRAHLEKKGIEFVAQPVRRIDAEHRWSSGRALPCPRNRRSFSGFDAEH